MDRERIGKYRVLGEIGRGTMGIVFEALDPVLNRRVALKTIEVPIGGDEEVLQRFRREAQAAALLNHPNIVTIHDYGEEGGSLYMAMELLHGPDLRDAIDQDLLGPLEQKLDVMDRVLDALEYAHSQQVVHRDVKPANIHLGSGRNVKIMDFGLARMNTSEMTQEGIVLGTPNYMSPEQALGDKVDGRSDIFSTGAVLYELLTGHKPFEADSTPSVLFQVVHKEPPAVERWVPGIPEPIIDVVKQALTKDRKKRFAGASEMRSALAAARQSATQGETFAPSASGRTTARGRRPGSSSARGRRARRRRSNLPLVAAGAGLALIMGLVAAAPWISDRFFKPGPTTEGGDDAQVGELTRALVATQVQLAQRELNDKNWAAAEEQAMSALRLSPNHPEATRTLETARLRIGELDTAISAARGEIEAGNNEAASEHLSRVLELDPRHPAATELSARLNAVFLTQAADAAQSMNEARAQAATGGAARTREFRDANATAARAQGLVETEEYADATRTFLEARDAFDRARRAEEARRAAAARPSPTPPAMAGAGEAETTPPVPAPTSTPAPVEVAALGASPAATPPPAPTLTVPPRGFTSGETTITTPSAGKLAGFETTDVKMQRPPKFVGRMEFEVLPSEVRPEEPFVVRLYMVNEGRKSVRIRRLELVTTENGERTETSPRPLQDEVDPQVRALVAEHSAVWAPVDTWSLEAVAAVDGDERVRIKLRSE